MAFLKSDTANEQQHAWVLCAGDRAEGSVGERSVETGKLRMVESIVRIGTEAEGDPLTYRYVAHERDIPDILARAIERSARRITQGVLRCCLEGSGVEPFLYRSRRTVDIWIAHFRYVLCAREDTEVVSLRDEV